eukprot:TRINITY_DN5923_c0_g1_i6.p1 TRINITY_DN5923_c0_g1~~TRINITY_DN5923_c0_g1_i6.p1  ORF type:complete len:732 (-),score=63.63 TRINITY_DN5923_c0_g1_i6:7327-9522(-)
MEQISPQQSPQRYKLAFPPSFAKTILFYIYNTESKAFKGKFTIKENDVTTHFETFDGIGYFARIYPSAQQDVFIEAIVEEAALIAIASSLREKVVSLDDPANILSGDYLASGKTNCYSTQRLSNGGTLTLQAEVPDLNIYVNPGRLPQNLSKSAYLYTKDDYVVAPAHLSFSAINIPIHKARVNPDRPTFICVESLNQTIAYSLDVGQYEPAVLDENQSLKLYLRGDERQLMVYSKVVQKQTPTKIQLKVTKGCINLFVKPRQTYYYGYLLNKNLSSGISPFENITEEEIARGDTVFLRATSGQKTVVKTIPSIAHDTLCTGKDVYVECPTFLVMENCNKEYYAESISHIMIQREHSPLVLPNEQTVIRVAEGRKETFVIPSVAPSVDKLKIHVQGRERIDSVKLAKITVAQKVGNKEKTIEVSGEAEIEFDKNSDGTLEGDYYATIEAYKNFNAMIWANSYSTIAGVSQEVHNARLTSSGNFFFLNPINETHQIGYYTFYSGDNAGKDVVIMAKPTGSLLGINLFVSSIAWPSKDTAKWQGQTVRLPMNNTYYYILAEGLSSPEETAGGKANGLFNFVILESQRFNVLEPGKKYRFGGTRVFRFDATKEGDYVLKKSGQTVETIYISIDPSNTLPFNEKYTYVVTPKEEEESENILNYQLIIPGKDLKKLGNNREVYFTVYCHWPRCLYDLSIEHVAGEDKKHSQRDKSDLQLNNPFDLFIKLRLNNNFK